MRESSGATLGGGGGNEVVYGSAPGMPTMPIVGAYATTDVAEGTPEAPVPGRARYETAVENSARGSGVRVGTYGSVIQRASQTPPPGSSPGGSAPYDTVRGTPYGNMGQMRGAHIDDDSPNYTKLSVDGGASGGGSGGGGGGGGGANYTATGYATTSTMASFAGADTPMRDSAFQSSTGGDYASTPTLMMNARDSAQLQRGGDDDDEDDSRPPPGAVHDDRISYGPLGANPQE
mmetsp:Transcript_13117/g.32396  ORF Transcript_13117/g.32396 Transcript_13117/m.32396 type:complete len:233 (-) Transcript_13117:118-816(-)